MDVHLLKITFVVERFRIDGNSSIVCTFLDPPHLRIDEAIVVAGIKGYPNIDFDLLTELRVREQVRVRSEVDSDGSLVPVQEVLVSQLPRIEGQCYDLELAYLLDVFSFNCFIKNIFEKAGHLLNRFIYLRFVLEV